MVPHGVYRFRTSFIFNHFQPVIYHFQNELFQQTGSAVHNISMVKALGRNGQA